MMGETKAELRKRIALLQEELDRSRPVVRFVGVHPPYAYFKDEDAYKDWQERLIVQGRQEQQAINEKYISELESNISRTRGENERLLKKFEERPYRFTWAELEARILLNNADLKDRLENAETREARLAKENHVLKETISGLQREMGVVQSATINFSYAEKDGSTGPPRVIAMRTFTEAALQEHDEQLVGNMRHQLAEAEQRYQDLRQKLTYVEEGLQGANRTNNDRQAQLRQNRETIDRLQKESAKQQERIVIQRGALRQIAVLAERTERPAPPFSATLI